NFNITYGLGTLTVLPVVATVTADDQVIYAGDTLPLFTATFEGFVKGETDTVVTGLSFTVDPAYTGAAGIYQIIPSAVAENYVFTPVNGTLYVNPFGPGTKHIKTRLRCVEELDEPDANGFLYVANFEYENDNATHVFIPVGEDNYFTSQGSYNNVNQPELFLAGGGSFTVPFDGSSLVWTVKSFRHNGNKTSVASQASSGSSRCLKLAPAEVLAGTDTNGDITNIYPNPVAGRLTIEMNQDADLSGGITVHDIYGKSFPVNIWQTSAFRAELDLSGLSAGIYFVRINLGETVTVHKIIKL
ncbi:MAG: T9SS type A sorting domain-containing protein, partial [Bacteroidales bacterium]|nr:T9SS type A sorting domain-containing protein [Bacteroidales bacterium]